MLTAAIVWALFVPLADWLARHDVGSARPALLQTARDAARGRLLTLAAGLFVAGALVFTALNFNLSREGQVTDRYTKAIEQLGSKKLDVRIGGIYALERVARDSAQDHPTVMEVLSAFIREHSHEPWPPPAVDEPGRYGVVRGIGAVLKRSPKPDVPEGATRPDVQAAVTVIGRRNARHDRQPVDLAGADLTHADLADADLTRADLGGADLTHADLGGADLRGAKLADADLTRADLRGADLTRAHLADAVLAGANLAGADLTSADLADADLTSADLRGGSVLTRAILGAANLRGANLTGAFMAPDAVIPAGWQRDTDSGQLKRADTGA